MSASTTRERIIEMVRKLRDNTVEKGCTLGEAEKFAAKAAELIEKYNIEEAELRGHAPTVDEIEVCQNKLATGAKVFNPGMTAVVNGLAIGVCCKVVLTYEDGQATYHIIGEQLDADYVCHISLSIIPALKTWAKLEGVQHGYEKAGLIRWTNQYLIGAGYEIQKRLVEERQERSSIREAEHLLGSGESKTSECTALVIVTGEMIAATKREAVSEAVQSWYQDLRKGAASRTSYDGTARNQGRKAGQRIGLHVGIESK